MISTKLPQQLQYSIQEYTEKFPVYKSNSS